MKKIDLPMRIVVALVLSTASALLVGVLMMLNLPAGQDGSTDSNGNPITTIIWAPDDAAATGAIPPIGTVPTVVTPPPPVQVTTTTARPPAKTTAPSKARAATVDPGTPVLVTPRPGLDDIGPDGTATPWPANPPPPTTR